MENRLKELVRDICSNENITQTELGYILGYTNTSSFFTAITKQYMVVSKKEKLCTLYGYQMNYKPKEGWTYTKIK